MKHFVLILQAFLMAIVASSKSEKQTVVSTIGSSEMTLEYWTVMENEPPFVVKMNGILSLKDGNTAAWDSTG